VCLTSIVYFARKCKQKFYIPVFSLSLVLSACFR